MELIVVVTTGNSLTYKQTLAQVALLALFHKAERVSIVVGPSECLRSAKKNTLVFFDRCFSSKTRMEPFGMIGCSFFDY